MERFRQTLENCELADLGYKGQWYTWSRGVHEESNVRERLDREVASSNWCSKFPEFEVTHLISSRSDHIPVLLTWQVSKAGNLLSRKKRMHFEALWVKETECETIIFDTWNSNWNSGISQKMEHVNHNLRKWHSRRYGKMRKDISDLKERLKNLHLSEPIETNLENIKHCRAELDKLLEAEETYWHQRSIVSWLREGDNNTSFFHRHATKRRKINKIEKLKNDEGEWCNNEEDIQNMVRGFYKTLYTSQGINRIEELLAAAKPTITEDMNCFLQAKFTKEGVRAACKQIHPTKSPGPDGMRLFYHKFWSTIGTDVISYSLDILNNGRSMDEINKTFIVLIPKVKNPDHVAQFRPISLCNVLYKIITKTIANRWKKVLPSCISENQSAFVPERLITDNVIIAHELMNSFKNKQDGKSSSFALKLDMTKAYDRVEWSFLAKMMSKMGFVATWVDLIMRCISSVSFSVVVNGNITDEFKSERGIRQGDPLSPYLFLICMEGFSALLNKAKEERSIRGIQACRGGPSINHLLFADDSLIFGKTRRGEINKIASVIELFEKSLGQLVNFSKSALMVSSRMSNEVKENLHLFSGSLPLLNQRNI